MLITKIISDRVNIIETHIYPTKLREFKVTKKAKLNPRILGRFKPCNMKTKRLNTKLEIVLHKGNKTLEQPTEVINKFINNYTNMNTQQQLMKAKINC